VLGRWGAGRGGDGQAHQAGGEEPHARSGSPHPLPACPRSFLSEEWDMAIFLDFLTAQALALQPAKAACIE
jgi:hypothetical protein